MTVVGEDGVYEQTTRVSLPWNVAPVPVRGDYIKITESVTDSHLVGQVFEITDQAKSGELRPSRAYSVHTVQEGSA